MYWLAGLLLGTGYGSLGLIFGSLTWEEEGGERVSTFGCGFEKMLSELVRFEKGEPGGMEGLVVVVVRGQGCYLACWL